MTEEAIEFFSPWTRDADRGFMVNGLPHQPEQLTKYQGSREYKEDLSYKQPYFATFSNAAPENRHCIGLAEDGVDKVLAHSYWSLFKYMYRECLWSVQKFIR